MADERTDPDAQIAEPAHRFDPANDHRRDHAISDRRKIQIVQFVSGNSGSAKCGSSSREPRRLGTVEPMRQIAQLRAANSVTDFQSVAGKQVPRFSSWPKPMKHEKIIAIIDTRLRGGLIWRL